MREYSVFWLLFRTTVPTSEARRTWLVVMNKREIGHSSQQANTVFLSSVYGSADTTSTTSVRSPLATTSLTIKIHQIFRMSIWNWCTQGIDIFTFSSMHFVPYFLTLWVLTLWLLMCSAGKHHWIEIVKNLVKKLKTVSQLLALPSDERVASRWRGRLRGASRPKKMLSLFCLPQPATTLWSLAYE